MPRTHNRAMIKRRQRNFKAKSTRAIAAQALTKANRLTRSRELKFLDVQAANVATTTAGPDRDWETS